MTLWWVARKVRTFFKTDLVTWNLRIQLLQSIMWCIGIVIWIPCLVLWLTFLVNQ